MFQTKTNVSRRTFITRTTAATAAVAAGSLVTNADLENVSAHMNTNSSSTDLKITDMRFAHSERSMLIRLDTNQGISGYGEIRYDATKTTAMFLKSRVIGMNPCNVAEIFRKIKKHGDFGTAGGGVSAVEVACWDLAGKAWGVPVWQMLGGKMRDRVRLYGDTRGEPDGEAMGNHLKQRVADGWTFLKMDLRAGGRRGSVEGMYTGPAPDPTANRPVRRGGGTAIGRPVPEEEVGLPMGRYNPYGDHLFTSTFFSEKALDWLDDYCATVRDIVGWEIPIATDHYGSMPIETFIKFARRLDKYNLAWYEDVVPWFYPKHLRRLKDSCTTPICTGEDVYMCEGFKELFENEAISVAHPDLANFGGILETKKLIDLATENGVASCIHNHNGPITLFASVHAAAAGEHFLACEYHQADNPTFLDRVRRSDKPNDPIIDQGFVAVPNGPGLGFEINMDVLKENLREPGLFEPTPEWDNETSYDHHT
ncbi:mandelate racemase/muconate lactonizing enzyme family protein [Candidatus Latescibacterota bacterium]